MDSVSGFVTPEARTVEIHIEGYPVHIKEIVGKLRNVARASLPGAHEFVYHGAINYSLPDSPGTWICYISGQRNYVNLGFFFGAHLSDPKNLLQGSGKRMRHVKIRTPGEASASELEDLIRQAWADAPTVASLYAKPTRQTGDDRK